MSAKKSVDPRFLYGKDLDDYYAEQKQQKTLEAGTPREPVAGPPFASGFRPAADAPPPGSLAEGASDASFKALDQFSAGTLPWARDKLADIAGVSEERQPRREATRAAIAERSPIAGPVGDAAGALGQFLLTRRAMPGKGLVGGTVGDMATGAGLNAIDQGTRGILDDKPFDPVEMGISTAASGAGRPLAATITRPIGAIASGIRSGANAVDDIMRPIAGAADDLYRGAAAPTKTAALLADPAGRAAVSNAIKGGTKWTDDVAAAQRESLLAGARAAPQSPLGLLERMPAVIGRTAGGVARSANAIEDSAASRLFALSEGLPRKEDRKKRTR